jgi:hypothetical protein
MWCPQTEANDDSKAGLYKVFSILKRDSYGCDRMVVRFILYKKIFL